MYHNALFYGCKIKVYITYLFNSCSEFLIVILSFFTFYTCFDKNKCKIGKSVGVLSALYLVSALFHLLWYLKVFNPSSAEYIFIESIFGVIKATIFIYIAYRLTKNKTLPYLSLLFYMGILIMYITSSNFIYSSIISYLVILIVFLNLEFCTGAHLKKVGLYGILYSFISILLIVITFIMFKSYMAFWFVPNLFLILVFFHIHLHVKNCNNPIEMPVKPSILAKVIKLPLFVIISAVFILFTVIAIHELGHAMAAKAYGCQYEVTFSKLDVSGLTTLKCDGYYSKSIILLSGLSLTLLFGFLLFLTSITFSTYLSYLIIGFSFLIANKDLIDFGASRSIIFILNYFAVVMAVVGFIKIALLYKEEYDKQEFIYCDHQNGPPKPITKTNHQNKNYK